MYMVINLNMETLHKARFILESRTRRQGTTRTKTQTTISTTTLATSARKALCTCPTRPTTMCPNVHGPSTRPSVLADKSFPTFCMVPTSTTLSPSLAANPSNADQPLSALCTRMVTNAAFRTDHCTSSIPAVSSVTHKPLHTILIMLTRCTYIRLRLLT